MTALTDDQSLPGSVLFEVADYNLGKVWQITVPRNGATPNPATAEIIAERPFVNGGYPALSDFGTLTFASDEAAQNGLAQSFHNFSNSRIFMTSNGSSGGTPLANPTDMNSSGGFTDSWQNCS